MSILQKAEIKAAKRAIPIIAEYIDPNLRDAVQDDTLAVLIQFTSDPAREIINPIIEFRNRECRGDFEPIRDDELTRLETGDSLAKNRAPMADAEFESAKIQAIQRGALWRGHKSLPIFVLARNIVESV